MSGMLTLWLCRDRGSPQTGGSDIAIMTEAKTYIMEVWNFMYRMECTHAEAGLMPILKK